MASLDGLPAEQRAVLALVLQRGQSFDRIAELLTIDRAAVRRRALDGLDAIGPDTAVDPLKRGLITDYLLGQLPPAVADSVYASLAENPPERAWARVVAAEIAPLAARSLPEIPAAGATSASGAPAAPEPDRRPMVSRGDSPVDGPPASSRRGGAILIGLIVLGVIVAVVVVLLVTGGSSTTKTSSVNASAAATTTTGTSITGTSTASTSVTPLHQINLSPPTAAKGREGAADVVRSGGRLGIVLVATGLAGDPASADDAYGVWLYSSKTQTGHFLGFYNGHVTSTGRTKGALEVESPLPADATSFNELLLTLETSEKPATPGTIVLEGTFAEN